MRDFADYSRRFIFLIVVVSLCAGCSDKPVEKFMWKSYRGVNASTNLSEDDVRDLAYYRSKPDQVELSG